ncbi:bifunctional PIG-L family deacetylase/class I SAM-dependent methyltransferase [Microcella humidisoli]|uniref:PIG-L family deacetylase n=1 Tax=Microcella humidisoli TaxID=2963406 RepID=A0ABY5FZ55_9MICO|nr:PIG-L family deacetylase [Microcella humidisoli]UTT63608.1 PIG-L family deacetylase [Microcella humidisoli]
MVIFDAREPGTSAREWQADGRWTAAPLIDLARILSLVVIAAHPDDETLGAGGIIASCAQRGVAVDVVIVTDGAAAGSPDGTGDSALAQRREREARAAIAVLAPAARVLFLRFADGRTPDDRVSIAAGLSIALADAAPDALVLAPWRGDRHRDHRVVGEIAAELVEPHRLGEYPVWMWHWGHPDHPDIDWRRMRAASIDARIKLRALAEYASQTEGAAPVLSAAVLDAAAADREFIVIDGDDAIADWLERAYARRDDPWRVESRWYEQRKRAITLASLPARRYGRALEVGCSIGVLTADLADRCDELLAVDLSARAVALARARLVGRADVTVEQVDVRATVPAGPFDLVVLSEVGYYFTQEQLEQALRELDAALGDHGTMLACHWRRPVAEHLLTGDQVHAVIAARGVSRIVHHVEADFVIDVYSRDACSVAQHEGIA